MSELEPINRESLVGEVKRLLPDPMTEEPQFGGDVVLVGGDPGEVIVRISSNRVSIAVFSIRWDGPYTPVIRSKNIATLNWKRLPASTTMMTLQMLINTAVDIRRAKYRNCEKCGESIPPEWMHDDDNCQSCAEKHLGVVY